MRSEEQSSPAFVYCVALKDKNNITQDWVLGNVRLDNFPKTILSMHVLLSKTQLVSLLTKNFTLGSGNQGYSQEIVNPQFHEKVCVVNS